MMSQEEIHKDLLTFLKEYYSPVSITYYDVMKEELELSFYLSDEERRYVKVFYKDNLHIFTEATEETERDIARIEEVHLRFDEEGVFFGKSQFDYTASNAAAFYLLNRYLEDMVEKLGDKLKYYKDHMLLQ
ncbi:MAG TPA: hypothetical protein DEA52_04305 [Clostridiaceae bacterium]|nr:hypothetical protein [Clostridiaceae bacterium]